MYEVISRGRLAKNVAATDKEILAAINGKLKARDEKGDTAQVDLIRTGRNGMAVGRPLGVTTGLPIYLALCFAFQQNEKAPKDKKLSDQKIAEWLRAEFPGRGTGYWDDIQEMRRYYNRGKYTRGSPPATQSHRYDSGGTQVDPTYKRKPKVKKKKAPSETPPR